MSVLVFAVFSLCQRQCIHTPKHTFTIVELTRGCVYVGSLFGMGLGPRGAFRVVAVDPCTFDMGEGRRTPDEEKLQSQRLEKIK